MARGLDFKQKEVINVKDGKSLGFVVDVNANFQNGEIQSIIVAKPNRLIPNNSGKNNIVINWENIVKIGEDVILVDV